MYIHILNPNAFCVGLYTLHTKHHIVITLIVCITKHTRSLRKSLLRGNLTEVILNTSNTLKDVLHMEKGSVKSNRAWNIIAINRACANYINHTGIHFKGTNAAAFSHNPTTLLTRHS